MTEEDLCKSLHRATGGLLKAYSALTHGKPDTPVRELVWEAIETLENVKAELITEGVEQPTG